MEQEMTEVPIKFVFYILLCLIPGTLTSCTYRFFQADFDYPVPGSLTKQFTMDSIAVETSGLLCMDSTIWTFNDSGGEAALYCLDGGNGNLIRKTIVRNAANVDWEDITEDDSHIFVADVGNNFASRDTVLIYRIGKKALLSEKPEINHDGIISFSFTGEVLRSKSGRSSHDCEALVAYGDSLYLFSKDWVEKTTAIYVLPKFPGHYELSPEHIYQAGFLVSGADVLPGSRVVSLVGYNNYIPVIATYTFEDSPALISCGGKARRYPFKAGRQVEGICYDPAGNLLISSERTLKKQALFRVGKPVL